MMPYYVGTDKPPAKLKYNRMQHIQLFRGHSSFKALGGAIPPSPGRHPGFSWLSLLFLLWMRSTQHTHSSPSVLRTPLHNLGPCDSLRAAACPQHRALGCPGLGADRCSAVFGPFWSSLWTSRILGQWSSCFPVPENPLESVGPIHRGSDAADVSGLKISTDHLLSSSFILETHIERN